MGDIQMSKTGILIVSFGTSYRETEVKTIEPIIRQVGKLFWDAQVRSAFTSKIIIKKLAGKGRKVSTPREALEQMIRDGFSHVIVQPLHFLSGHEYHKKVVAPLEPLRDRLEGFAIGYPLVTHEEDYDRIIECIEEITALLGDEKLILMGHGSDHPADKMYSRLQELMDSKSINAMIATVNGAVRITDLIPKLQKEKVKKVHLHPLMLVAGDHAQNDMAGGDEDSWKNILLQEGIQVKAHIKGVGEYYPLRRIVIDHIRESKRKLFPDRYKKMQESASRKKLSAPREEVSWFPSVDQGRCIGCGICYLFCPKLVYKYNNENRKVQVVFPYSCVVNCSKCTALCPVGAITFPENKIVYE